MKRIIQEVSVKCQDMERARAMSDPNGRQATRRAGPRPRDPPFALHLLPAELVELPVPDTTEKSVPLVWRETEYRTLGVPTVPDTDLAARQASHLNAVAVCVTQRAFHPFGLTFDR